MGTNNFQMNSLRWNLESLYAGGSSSAALQGALQRTKQEVKKFSRKFKQLSDLKKGILHFQELEGEGIDLEEFVNCLLAQNVDDQEAQQLHSQIAQLSAELRSLGEELSALLATLDDETFNSLLVDPEVQPIAFHLQEKRERVKEKLPVEQECLVNQLAIDGYQGWNDLYELFMGQLRIPSPENGAETLSVGQADNKLTHPNRKIRQGWFYQYQETWVKQENLVAQFLNHLAGFRIQLYQARKWPSVLDEPLFVNRMQEETLDTMWKAIEEKKEILKQYLACKAQLLGLKRLSWYDVEAPLPFSSFDSLSFDQATQLIVEAFSKFSPAMGALAHRAFHEGWIEAEDRAGKRQGGFCVFFSKAKESRIFMTYSGTMTNVLTLAHELGHAYHGEEVKELPIFAQQYPMNLAETASTLAETVVMEALMRKSLKPENQLAVLDIKLQRAVIFLMNIHARFIFEKAFYQERRKGFVFAKELNHLMEKAQQEAYRDTLEEWYPHFWLAKQHFYATQTPFYNFPYTFGYLFSLGIYAHFQENPPAERGYASLLQDTGRMRLEELANKHLGMDLQEPLFWQKGLDLIEKDVTSYLKLASNVKKNG